MFDKIRKWIDDTIKAITPDDQVNNIINTENVKCESYTKYIDNKKE